MTYWMPMTMTMTIMMMKMMRMIILKKMILKKVIINGFISWYCRASNVGKSTLFSAITGSDVPSIIRTIDPNVGIVSIPDHRIQKLSNLSQSEKNIPSVIEFVDIAGLVKGASDGEGLGNKFLSNIRATSVIAHVVRCFDSSDVIHVQGNVDPLRDVDIIDTELLLADIAFLEKRIETQKKKIKSNDKDEVFKLTFFERLLSELEQSNPIRMLTFTDKEQELLQELQLITSKQVIYVANVDELGLNNDSDYIQKLRDYAQSKSSGMIKICSQLELELSHYQMMKKVSIWLTVV